MWPSASLALARLQMRSKRPKGPPPMPEGINGDHQALWGFMMHLSGRIDGLYGLVITGVIATVLGVIAIFVTVLVQ